jgi:RNA polymerase sigma-70 factor (ECF subfamily)
MSATEQIQSGETDERLLDRFRGGDLAAVGEFYRRYCRPVYLYAFSLTRDPALAEDIVQQSFVRLLQQDPKGIGSVRGLLFAIARNLLRDDVRRAAGSRAAFPILERAATDGPDVDRIALSRALQALPGEQREVVLLRIYADLPFAEIAATLDVPEPTVKSRYRYALNRMEELLNER